MFHQCQITRHQSMASRRLKNANQDKLYNYIYMQLLCEATKKYKTKKHFNSSQEKSYLKRNHRSKAGISHSRNLKLDKRSLQIQLKFKLLHFCCCCYSPSVHLLWFRTVILFYFILIYFISMFPQRISSHINGQGLVNI